MQNEFEKQVQQKMEELNLVPSEPVWQKVEMQIRKKNDRRRLIFWIPLFALLLGGGLWLGINQYINDVAYRQSKEEAQKEHSIDSETGKKKTKSNTRKIKENETLTVNKSGIKKDVETITIKKANNNPHKNFIAGKKVLQQTTQPKKNLITQKNELPGDNTEATTSYEIVPITTEKINQFVSSFDIVRRTDTTSAFPVNREMKPVLFIPDSFKKDSSSTIMTEIKKRTVFKWKFNLVAFAGVSDLNRIQFYNGQKSFQSPNSYPGSSTGGGTVYAGPSEIQKGFSFAIGAAMQKQLGRKSFFITGLQYNYYSNTMNVGTVVMQNRVIMDFTVSQYYSGQSAVLQPYRNQYHFVSVPMIVDWQLFKKLPLHFNTGLSLQYLVQTNALRFDYSTQSYFHNRKAFNPLQLLFASGLTYSLPVKQNSLAIGPQLQYGFTRLEKGNADHHLFSYGLKAQWSLNKK